MSTKKKTNCMQESSSNINLMDWSVESCQLASSAINYIENLFESRARLLVVRIDLHYRNESNHLFQSEEIRDRFNKFLGNIRQRAIGKDLIGYLWSLEYGESTGFHYHCMFFYDANKRQRDIYIGNELGNYWQEKITENQGSFYCSNRDKERLGENGVLGIGKVHRDDLLTRRNLTNAACYMVKSTETTRSYLHGTHRRFRVFGRKVLPYGFCSERKKATVGKVVKAIPDGTPNQVSHDRNCFL